MDKEFVQNKITEQGKLLDENGLLLHKGYATDCILDYDPKDIKLFPSKLLNKMRTKEWDYYGITTKDFFFAVCVTNIGYIGIVFAYLVDFKTNEIIKKELPTPLGYGCKLPTSSKTGNIHFSNFGVNVDFFRGKTHREIKVDWKNFHKNKSLQASLTLQQPDSRNSILMCTPIGEKHFYYNHKINCMPATGSIKIGESDYNCTNETALACLDWGRGVWEYSTFWNWASASGFLPDGRIIGLNLGKGFGDLSHATENTFYIDGQMNKLDKLELSYNRKNCMEPWIFKTSDSRLDLTFTPFIDNATKVNLLISKAEGHQMFGKYSGKLITNEGETIEISDLIGWAEEHDAKW